MEVNAIYLYKDGLYKNICNVIRFRRRPNKENMSKRMTYRTHKALQLLYFDLFLMKQYNILCLILGVNGCLQFLHKIVVYRHFLYFQYGFQNGHQRSRDYFFIVGSNKSFIY